MMNEERRYTSTHWIKEGLLPKFRLPNGGLVSVLFPVNLLRRVNEAAGTARPLFFTEDEFKAFLKQGKLEICQTMVAECPACDGKGKIGMEGYVEVCPVCAGYGRSLTPFGVAVIELFDFINNARPLVCEEVLEKQNRLYHLKEKIHTARARAAEAVGYSLTGEMQVAELKARQKVMDEQKKAAQKAEAKLAKELAEVEALEAELSGK